MDFKENLNDVLQASAHFKGIEVKEMGNKIFIHKVFLSQPASIELIHLADKHNFIFGIHGTRANSILIFFVNGN